MSMGPVGYCTLILVYLTTALNVLWGLLAVLTFGYFAGVEFHKRPESGDTPRRKGAGRRFWAVALIVLALFPCISASDDILGFALLSPRGQQNSSAEDKVSAQLANLLQSLEHLQIAPIFALVFALSFFGLVALTGNELCGRHLQALPGRAPPR